MEIQYAVVLLVIYISVNRSGTKQAWCWEKKSFTVQWWISKVSRNTESATVIHERSCLRNKHTLLETSRVFSVKIHQNVNQIKMGDPGLFILHTFVQQMSPAEQIMLLFLPNSKIDHMFYDISYMNRNKQLSSGREKRPRHGNCLQEGCPWSLWLLKLGETGPMTYIEYIVQCTN